MDGGIRDTSKDLKKNPSTMNGVFSFLADLGEHGKTSHLNANYCENEIAYKEAEQERNV